LRYQKIKNNNPQNSHQYSQLQRSGQKSQQKNGLHDNNYGNIAKYAGVFRRGKGKKRVNSDFEGSSLIFTYTPPPVKSGKISMAPSRKPATGRKGYWYRSV